jgi:hypothetical protein
MVNGLTGNVCVIVWQTPRSIIVKQNKWLNRIMKRKTAEGLNKVILTYNKKLSDYVPKLRDELGTEDFKSFSDPVGHMLALSFDVLDLIWAEYPDLMPDEAKE